MRPLADHNCETLSEGNSRGGILRIGGGQSYSIDGTCGFWKSAGLCVFRLDCFNLVSFEFLTLSVWFLLARAVENRKYLVFLGKIKDPRVALKTGILETFCITNFN